MLKTIRNNKLLALLISASLALPASAQYCSTSYTSSQCINYNMFIDDVKTTGGITNINNQNSKCGNTSTSYIYYSNKVHEGVQGTNVGISVTIGASYPQGVRVWVDFNRDGDFTDAGENVITQSLSANGTLNKSFQIPANAEPGESRMRIRSVYSTTSMNPCGSASYGEVEDYKFIIVPSCPSEVTTQAPDLSECETAEAKFTISTIKVDSVKWQYDDGSGFSDIDDDLIFSGTESHTLVINKIENYMNGNRVRPIVYNYKESCSIKGDEATLTVIPFGQSSVNITAADVEICEGQAVSLNSYYTNGGTNPEFQWMINGVDTPGMNSGSYVATDVKDGDTIALRFISKQVCVFPEISNKIVFKVNEIAHPEVDLSVTYEPGTGHTFTAIPANGGDNPKYQWYRNEKVVHGENGPTYTSNDIMPYERVVVELFSSLECIDERRVSSEATYTGMSDVAISPDAFNIYPNPSKGSFVIKGKLDNISNETATIQIVNNLGRVVQQINTNVQGSELSIPVDLESSLPNGIYSANITIGNNTSSIRFILNR